MSSNVYTQGGSGAPTKPEVDALMQMSEGLGEGHVMTWRQIEETMGVSRRSNRGGSVLAAWKRRLFEERNVVLRCVNNRGYEIADPGTRVDLATKKVSAASKQIVGAATVAAATDRRRLSADARRACEHLASIPARLHLAALTAPRPVEE